ncbi:MULTISPECIES: hypothetical protein [unclassified Burkholderia]|uniref:hypothetical protein n=1 Tax=unclassified Burkholderia TaxID=2613784 RepID=UPI000F57ED81|nr:MULTISPECIES: hypothetical protein [unclassified Burkholderia]
MIEPPDGSGNCLPRPVAIGHAIVGRMPHLRRRIAPSGDATPSITVFSPILTLLRMDDEDRSVRCEPARRRRNAAVSALAARPGLSVHSREYA